MRSQQTYILDGVSVCVCVFMPVSVAIKRFYCLETRYRVSGISLYLFLYPVIASQYNLRMAIGQSYSCAWGVCVGFWLCGWVLSLG